MDEKRAAKQADNKPQASQLVPQKAPVQPQKQAAPERQEIPHEPKYGAKLWKNHSLVYDGQGNRFYTDVMTAGTNVIQRDRVYNKYGDLVFVNVVVVERTNIQKSPQAPGSKDVETWNYSR